MERENHLLTGVRPLCSAVHCSLWSLPCRQGVGHLLAEQRHRRHGALCAEAAQGLLPHRGRELRQADVRVWHPGHGVRRNPEPRPWGLSTARKCHDAHVMMLMP